ncbi:hypothetical protein [[Phormidium] sp. ETS-05]|uniref:hypothetical protein n=1 Tax=[Phormidium] sp. ETS-05 TaxID=222819 RepID=UPI0018EEDE20|nr:hypothetical protein [[Phormidium] sp. ETS-05]
MSNGNGLGLAGGTLVVAAKLTGLTGTTAAGIATTTGGIGLSSATIGTTTVTTLAMTPALPFVAAAGAAVGAGVLLWHLCKD